MRYQAALRPEEARILQIDHTKVNRTRQVSHWFYPQMNDCLQCADISDI
jgi:hypothetical protein